MEKKEHNGQQEVSFFWHEQECWRLERIHRRLWLAELIGLALLIGSNVVWVWHFLEVVR